jgi:23S rRNA (uracil1939-C5)-methyltransferase
MDELYKVTHIQPVDMFPQTHHVENIVVLELK